MGEPSPIRNVSDTALWVAIWRAMESERPDAIFHDPYARRLGGTRGEAIAARMGGPKMNWPIVVRTAVMDEIILRCIRDGVANVLNLAAGLDTRPYRLELPASLRWLHVDLPEMADYFRDGMAGESPRCQLELVAADMRDADARRALFERVAALPGTTLVITEGLLLYLEADDVVALSRDLHDIAGASWWLTDLASPALLKFLAHRWKPTLVQGNAPFRFGPANGSAFFAPQGWCEIEFRSTLIDAWKLDRKMPFAWLLRALSWLQPRRRREDAVRMSSVVLMGRSQATQPIHATETSQ
ncbi:class I SAM-dependent methyltransferase [soil metagenome]